jgi:hypothetical protein
LTPNHLVQFARLMLAALLGLTAATITAPPHVTAILCYFATGSLFVACPRLRAADLAASALAMVALLCFAEAMQTGVFTPTRFSLAAAAIGAAVLPLKLSRIRRLAGHNGYRPLSNYKASQRRRTDPAAPKRSFDAKPLLLPRPLVLTPD